MGLPMLIRPMERSDLPLVTNNWLESARKCYHVKGIPNDTYYPHTHRIIQVLLSRGGVFVMCDPEDPYTVYGWICAEVINNHLLIHYVYVKRRFRKYGVGKALMRAVVEAEPDVHSITLTFETMAGRFFFRKLDEEGLLPHEPTYNPYALYSSLPLGWGDSL